MATSTDLRAAIEEVQLALPAERVRELDLENFDEKAALEKFAKRVGALPWWTISTAVHTVIFLLCTLLAMMAPPIGRRNENVRIRVEVTKQRPPIYTTPPRVRAPIFNPSAVNVTGTEKVKNPIAIHTPIRTDHNETEDRMNDLTARGEEDNISDIPHGGQGVVGVLGVGGGGMAGIYGRRGDGGRQRAVRRYCGSPATESAVEASLAWLHRHQERDGHWQAAKWQATLDQHRVNVSMTSFALLAFLGAGYTESNGRYRDTVRRAQHWLLQAQKKGSARCREKGRFDRCMYTQGIAGLALAEAYGMSLPRGDRRLKAAAQDAVNVIVKAQGHYEGWNYTSKRGKAGRNDTSVTGWNLMALKSARLAGLNVDQIAFQGCMQWLDRATNPKNGRCAYAGTKDRVRKGSGSHAMWAAGMLMRQFMGMSRRAPVVVAAADSIGKYPPQWKAGGKGVNFYYWYYGTLCMFQQGGNHWKNWNESMKKALCENQRSGGPTDGTAKDVDGSWDPVGAGGIPRGGRVFSTALGALCLEVYYRYLPMYGANK